MSLPRDRFLPVAQTQTWRGNVVAAGPLFTSRTDSDLQRVVVSAWNHCLPVAQPQTWRKDVVAAANPIQPPCGANARPSRGFWLSVAPLAVHALLASARMEPSARPLQGYDPPGARCVWEKIVRSEFGVERRVFLRRGDAAEARA